MFMKGAQRGRCEWHIVNRNFRIHVLLKNSFPNNNADYDNVTLIIQNWMYSWMKDECEIEEEFIVSKRMLHWFVKSSYVTSRLGSVYSGSVLLFLKNVVEPLESTFCYYLKNRIRHYGAYSNSSHEGTNNAIKHCSAKVFPIYNIESSLKISVKGSERNMIAKRNKINSQDKKFGHDFHDLCSCHWSIMPLWL